MILSFNVQLLCLKCHTKVQLISVPKHSQYILICTDITYIIVNVPSLVHICFLTFKYFNTHTSCYHSNLHIIIHFHVISSFLSLSFQPNTIHITPFHYQILQHIDMYFLIHFCHLQPLMHHVSCILHHIDLSIHITSFISHLLYHTDMCAFHPFLICTFIHTISHIKFLMHHIDMCTSQSLFIALFVSHISLHHIDMCAIIHITFIVCFSFHISFACIT